MKKIAYCQLNPQLKGFQNLLFLKEPFEASEELKEAHKKQGLATL